MDTQHTIHVHPVVICAVSGSAIFSTLFNKRHYFIKKYYTCVLIFSTTFVWNISHFKTFSVEWRALPACCTLSLIRLYLDKL